LKRKLGSGMKGKTEDRERGLAQGKRVRKGVRRKKAQGKSRPAKRPFSEGIKHGGRGREAKRRGRKRRSRKGRVSKQNQESMINHHNGGPGKGGGGGRGNLGRKRAKAIGNTRRGGGGIKKQDVVNWRCRK